MGTTENRIDNIEKSLSPKQAMIAWIEEAHQFKSLNEYVAQIIARPEEITEFATLIEQVELSVPDCKQGEPSEKRRKAVRNSVREAAFLYYLHLRVNEHFHSEVRVMAVRSLLLLERASAALREATLARSDPARDDRWRQDLSAHAIEVFTLKGAIDDLSRRYFDKHQVLWKSSAEQLEDIVDVINMIATKREEAVYLAFKRRRRGRKPHLGHCEEEGTGFDFDLEELKKLVDPRKAARSLEKLAYAEALLFMGDRRAAAELAESLVCPSA